MRKLMLLVMFLIASCSVVSAQHRTFGVRVGYSIGASGQYYIGKENMLQIDIDLLAYNWAVQSTITYNGVFFIKSWINNELNAFVGIGIGGGYCWHSYYDGLGIISEEMLGRFWFIGASTNLGLELNFKSGLQLFIDWRPVFAPVLYKDGSIDYFVEGLFIGACAIGVRYKFNK